ncbi:hypothetical protein [Neomesorhizobium albiziae]|uniref:hypothetical protein n=1 Tax=Neomesorhizobium albiziae TaxID=335020 RepID=UPI00165F0DA4|nr:hypothetical protein [Mesorhizobium albiziae]
MQRSDAHQQHTLGEVLFSLSPASILELLHCAGAVVIAGGLSVQCRLRREVQENADPVTTASLAFQAASKPCDWEAPAARRDKRHHVDRRQVFDTDNPHRLSVHADGHHQRQ